MIKPAHLALAFAALATGACSAAKTGAAGNSASAQAAPAARTAALNPCTLATRSEAAAAMGKPSSAGQFRKYGQGFCHWDGPTPDYEIYIQLADADLVDSFAHMPGTVTVSGMGDRAVWGKDGALYLSKHAHGAEINFTIPGSNAKMTPAERRFAQEVAARM